MTIAWGDRHPGRAANRHDPESSFIARDEPRSEREMNDPGLNEREGRDGEQEQDANDHALDMRQKPRRFY
jgi:hypothetical protein